MVATVAKLSKKDSLDSSGYNVLLDLNKTRTVIIYHPSGETERLQLKEGQNSINVALKL